MSDALPKFVFMRHGDWYGQGEPLTPESIEIVKATAERIKALIQGESCVVYSSWSPRAKNTAKLVSDVLETGKFECRDALTNSDGYEKLRQLLEEFSKAHPSGYVICVTHALECGYMMMSKVLPEGQAILILNAEREEYSRI